MTIPKACETHTKGDGSWWAKDARGIEICRVCAECIDEKLSHYRPDVLDDPQYWTTEDVEDDSNLMLDQLEEP